MAGRGRGRGRGKGLSFNVESLGFGRGESLPGSILEPPPKFPPLELKPVPLLTGDHYDYLLALKQEYTANMRESCFFLKPPEKKRDIDRYTDKYQLSSTDVKIGKIVWSALPSELRSGPKRLKKKPPVKKAAVSKSRATEKEAEKIVRHLEELEKTEVSSKDIDLEEDEEEEESCKKKTGEEGEEDEQVEEEEIDEEELEEETDYAQTYFDNGEGFALDEDDDMDEGALY